MAVTLLDKEIDRLPDIAKREGGATLLIGMLDEDGEHFDGLSIEETDWFRGHIYAAIALSDAPSVSLKHAREDLRTSSSPNVLAGIARVLRSIEAGAEWCDDVEAAQRRIQFSDQYPDFRFDPPPSPCCGARTSLQELDAALAAIRSTGRSGNTPAIDDAAEFLGAPSAAFYSAALEDQDGKHATFARLTVKKPMLLAFFYTRCMNPLKCSLTVSRLARCAQAEPRLGYVGMSYDPEYDTPHRLRVYGEDRGIPFSADIRLVRSLKDWTEIKGALELRAGYGATTINSHAREVFLVASDKRLWRIPPDWLLDAAKFVDFCREVEAL